MKQNLKIALPFVFLALVVIGAIAYTVDSYRKAEFYPLSSYSCEQIDLAITGGFLTKSQNAMFKFPYKPDELYVYWKVHCEQGTGR